MTDSLPPLPDGDLYCHGATTVYGGEYFTAEQMRAYAIAALAAPKVSDPAPAVAGEVDSPIDAADNADYIEHCAAKLERAGYRITGLALSAIAAEHRDHARIVAEKDARHAALVADYIELNDMHARQGLFAYKTLRRAEAAEQRAEAMAGLLRNIHPYVGSTFRDSIDALTGQATPEGA